MEMEKLKKKLAAHVSRNTENVFSGLICASVLQPVLCMPAPPVHLHTSHPTIKIVFLHLRYF